MSIAIVAAVLACVTMLGHRSHNETLRLQGEALSLQTEAGIHNTKSANQWARYQSKNIFNLESEIALDFLSVIPIREDKKKEFDALVARYEGTVEHYMGDKTYRTSKTEKSASASESENSAGGKREDKKAKGKLAKYEKEARDWDKKTDELVEKAKAMVEKSHLEHLRAARFDYGELALQLAVVLCSLAILTRNRSFWFIGLVSGVVGAAVAITAQFGMFMGGHH
jgi:hypothetical protein